MPRGAIRGEGRHTQSSGSEQAVKAFLDADYDLDGWLDLLVGHEQTLSTLFHVAFGDVDRDGDQDIVQNVGGFVPADAYAKLYFRNATPPRPWIGLQLVGTRTNRGAIGARIAVTGTNGDGTRRIHRVVGSGGSFGANPLAQHIGLGAAARAERIEIYWPVSRTTQLFESVDGGRVLRITEGAKTFDVVR